MGNIVSEVNHKARLVRPEAAMWIAQRCSTSLCGRDFRELCHPDGSTIFDEDLLHWDVARAYFNESYRVWYPKIRVIVVLSIQELQTLDIEFVPTPCRLVKETGCQIRRTYLIDYLKWILEALGEAD